MALRRFFSGLFIKKIYTNGEIEDKHGFQNKILSKKKFFYLRSELFSEDREFWRFSDFSIFIFLNESKQMSLQRFFRAYL